MGEKQETGSRKSVVMVMCPQCQATSFRLLVQDDDGFLLRCTGCSRDYENAGALSRHDTGVVE